MRRVHVNMAVEADLANLLGDLSEAQMVALESPNTWVRRGERERASVGSKMAHPGGVISSNKAEATAAFYLCTGRPLPSGNGAAGGAVVLPAPAGEPCSAVAVVPAAPSPATRRPRTSTLSQAEFDAAEISISTYPVCSLPQTMKPPWRSRRATYRWRGPYRNLQLVRPAP
jgi:hypothetical protein